MKYSRVVSDELASWGSPAYAEQWAEGDVLADLLSLPRKMSVALVAEDGLAVNRVVDLGSGPGAYLEVFMEAFSSAIGVWVDGSEAMLAMAKENLERFGDRIRFQLADLSDFGTVELGDADVVTTSRLVHHFDEATIRGVYGSVFAQLAPGGFFFNLDHFGAAPGWEKRLRAIRSTLIPNRPQPLQPHSHDYPLRTVPEHLDWLAAAGFEPPDIVWKSFHTALVAARKPV